MEGNEKQKFGHFYKKWLVLTLGGAAVFWATTFVTSLLPIAAKYRAAFSNASLHSVWVGAMIAGVILGGCVSYLILRFFDKIPSKSLVIKSVILSISALVVSVLIIDLPMALPRSNEAWHYFFIGVIFNSVRFVLLGLVIGHLYRKLQQN